MRSRSRQSRLGSAREAGIHQRGVRDAERLGDRELSGRGRRCAELVSRTGYEGECQVAPDTGPGAKVGVTSALSEPTANSTVVGETTWPAVAVPLHARV